MTSSTNAFSPKSIAMLALNATGIFAYLSFAKPCWIEPELADFPGASGGASIIWGLTAFPILLLFLLLNSLWVLVIGIAYLRHRGTAIQPALWLALVLWGVAIYVDFSHHGS